jgi:NAD(P) transhydrogenase subunit beta
MSANVAALLYLVAGILFILALRGLSHPETSRQGNTFGMVGMGIAILTTLGLLGEPSSILTWLLIAGGLGAGGFLGAKIAREIPMTQMPELVAAFHSLVGLAAVFVAAGALYSPEAFGILADPADPSAGIMGPSAPSPLPARSSPSPNSPARCRARPSCCPCATSSTSRSLLCWHT